MGVITMKKVNTEIGKFVQALMNKKAELFDIYMLRESALTAIKNELRKKYPSEMSGKIEVDYERATEIRALGQCGLIPNPLFMPIFLIIQKYCKMSPQVAAHLLKDAYTSCSCICKEDFVRVINRFDYLDFLYDDELKKEYYALPQQLTIFRGGCIEEYNECNFGCSWTTDRACAEFFAFREKKKRAVFSLEVDKSEFFYFGNDRNENEIIYSSNINKEKVKVVTKKPTVFYQEWYRRFDSNSNNIIFK